MKGNCTHCNTAIGCGCNRATGSDGSVIHKKCLNKYNNSLLNIGEIIISPETNSAPFNPGMAVIPPTTAR
mgnify:CR=1 FL=1